MFLSVYHVLFSSSSPIPVAHNIVVMGMYEHGFHVSSHKINSSSVCYLETSVSIPLFSADLAIEDGQ